MKDSLDRLDLKELERLRQAPKLTRTRGGAQQPPKLRTPENLLKALSQKVICIWLFASENISSNLFSLLPYQNEASSASRGLELNSGLSDLMKSLREDEEARVHDKIGEEEENDQGDGAEDHGRGDRDR